MSPQLGAEERGFISGSPDCSGSYILELASGVTGRIVELLRLSARCAMRRDSRRVNIEHLQEAGKEFASDLGSERNVTH
jgi:hypothetical protein